MPSSLSLSNSRAAINPYGSSVILQGAGRSTRHRPLSLFGPVVLKKAVRDNLFLVNIVGDVDGLSKAMLLIGSEEIA